MVSNKKSLISRILVGLGIFPILNNSCQLDRSTRPFQQESEVATQFNGAPIKIRRSLHYTFKDGKGNLIGKLVPQLSPTNFASRNHYDADHYAFLLYKDNKIYKSKRDFNIHTGYALTAETGIKPITIDTSKEVSWEFEDLGKISGYLSPDNDIIDPDLPKIGEEVLVYYSRPSLREKTMITPVTYKIVNMSWKVLQPYGTNKKTYELLSLEAEINKGAKNLLKDFPRIESPVYKRDSSGAEKLYGFITYGSVDSETHKISIDSIHSISIKSLIKNRHNPVCDIRSTPAYNAWWQETYCSAEYVGEAIKMSQPSEPTCEATIPLGPNGRHIRNTCNQSQVLQAIESMAEERSSLDKPVEGKYQCSKEWTDRAQEISNAYYQQYSGGACKDIEAFKAAMKKRSDNNKNGCSPNK